MTDIDSGDMAGATLQQHFAEAAGRGADIQAIEVTGRERKTIESVTELEGGARYIGSRIIGNGDEGTFSDRLSWLGDRDPVDRHRAAFDRIACPRARRIEATPDQRFIVPFPGHPASRGSVPEGVPSALSVIFSMRASASLIG